MKPFVCLVALAYLACPAPTSARDDKGNVVGAIWKFTMTNGTEQESGQFRVHKYVVYKGAKKVGIVRPRGTESTLTITDFPKLNGKVELRKIKKDPPHWRGTFHKTDGTKWDITVEIKDR
jgi:hypothetical protein